MPRKDDLRGIETRTDAKGREQYRPYVTHPEDRNRKLRGEWTYVFPEAKGWRVRMLAKTADGVPLIDPEPTLPTIEEASVAFLAGAESGAILARGGKPYAPKTVRGYRGHFRDYIVPELGALRIDELRRSQVQRFLDGLQLVVSGQTVRNIVHALGALYSYLLPRHDEVAHDPMTGLVLPAPSEPRKRYADRDEMARLLGALPHDLAMPYALAFLAGLRNGEIQALPADHVDLDGGWLDVAWSIDSREGFKGPKSYAGVRSVPIFDDLRPYLEAQLARLEGPLAASTEDAPGSLLLPSKQPGRWGTQTLGTPFLRKCVKAWEAESLNRIGLHEARHSFATALLRAGYDVKQVSEWVGHSDAATTLRVYVKGRGRSGDVAALTGRMNRYLLGE